jgi:transmembrane sensor
MNQAFEDKETEAQRLAEAANWRIRLTEAGAETELDFEYWLSRDPGNLAAWQRVQSPWDLLGEQATSPELLTARQAALGHARKSGEKRWGPRLGSSHRLSAVAASALLLALGGLVTWNMLRPDVYSTATGERRMVTLNDGSRLSLDSESEVRVSYNSRARDVRLVRGQALFAVARDVERPFSVEAGGRKVVATGTEFNVDLLETELFVTLVEGHVVVLPGEAPSATRATGGPPTDPLLPGGIELVAGEQLAFRSKASPSVRRVDVKLATAWESGRLVFENEPLSAVAARVSRYNNHTLRIADARAAELRISGVFAADDMDGFISTVTAYLPVRVQTNAAGDIALRHR